MSKDAYWFKHDANATRDLKLIELRAIHNLDGLAMFWMVLEVMREQKNYSWHYDKLGILAGILSIPAEKLKTFITDCVQIGLFQIKDNYIFSERLLYDMGVWESKAKSRKGKTKSKRINNENGTKQEDEINKTNKNKGTSGIGCFQPISEETAIPPSPLDENLEHDKIERLRKESFEKERAKRLEQLRNEGSGN